MVGRQVPHAFVALDESLERIAVVTPTCYVLPLQFAEGDGFVSGIHVDTPESWHWSRFPPLEGGIPGTAVRGSVPMVPGTKKQPMSGTGED